MADTTVTIKFSPYEFDLLRRAIGNAIEAEKELQENIADEATGEDGVKRVAEVPEWRESKQREAAFALLLENLQ